MAKSYFCCPKKNDLLSSNINFELLKLKQKKSCILHLLPKCAKMCTLPQCAKITVFVPKDSFWVEFTFDGVFKNYVDMDIQF